MFVHGSKRHAGDESLVTLDPPAGRGGQIGESDESSYSRAIQSRAGAVGFLSGLFGGTKKTADQAQPGLGMTETPPQWRPPGGRPVIPDERVPSRPVGMPVAPWASETIYTGVVGESHYPRGFVTLFKARGLRLTVDGTELTDVAAHLAPDGNNPFDGTAVAVWAHDQMLGFLPRETAADYFPSLSELADEGKHLCVNARIWASLDRDGSVYGSASVHLPPRAGVQPFNALPDDAHVVIPHGRTIQVTGEEGHMDVLGRYVADQTRYLAVTLHTVTEAKTPRSTPYEAVEVRLDGERVGVLTKAMSEQLRDLVTHVRSHGKAPVCRAVLKGSPLRAELSLAVARSSEVTRAWLDSV